MKNLVQKILHFDNLESQEAINEHVANLIAFGLAVNQTPTQQAQLNFDEKLPELSAGYLDGKISINDFAFKSPKGQVDDLFTVYHELGITMKILGVSVAIGLNFLTDIRLLSDTII